MFSRIQDVRADAKRRAECDFAFFARNVLDLNVDMEDCVRAQAHGRVDGNASERFQNAFTAWRVTRSGGFVNVRSDVYKWLFAV